MKREKTAIDRRPNLIELLHDLVGVSIIIAKNAMEREIFKIGDGKRTAVITCVNHHCGILLLEKSHSAFYIFNVIVGIRAYADVHNQCWIDYLKLIEGFAKIHNFSKPSRNVVIITILPEI